MANKGPGKEVVTEYPYQSIYRPWSWVFSSSFNIFLLMVLVGIAYMYYRRRKSVRRNSVTYRTKTVHPVDPQDTKKVALVTGGSGSLGKELVKVLVDNGSYRVHSLDLLLPEENCINEGVCTYIQADVTNIDDLSIAFRGVDVVFHCASLIPKSVRFRSSDFHRVNVGGTETVLKACTECGVKRLIYTSTASITLSKNPKLVSQDCDESCPIPSDPLNPYVASKGLADKLVRDANGKEGLLTCVLRPNAFVEYTYEVLEKNPYNLTGYDFDFSLDSTSSIAQAHILAEKKLLEGGISATVAGRAYNIGEEKSSIGEIAKFIADEKKVSIFSIPISLVRFLARVNEIVYGLTGLVIVDELTSLNTNMKIHTYVCGRARQELGWVHGPSWKEVVRGLIKRGQEDNKIK